MRSVVAAAVAFAMLIPLGGATLAPATSLAIPQAEPLVGTWPAWLAPGAWQRAMAGEAVRVDASLLPRASVDDAPALPYETLHDARIRPGAWMAFPEWCTFNFVFRDAATGRYAIGTAGHCVHELGQEVWLASLAVDPDGSVEPEVGSVPDPARCVYAEPPGPGEWGAGVEPECVTEEAGRAPSVESEVVLVAYRIGTVVAGSNLDGALGPDGVGSDFALVAIDPSLDGLVDPRINAVDGPCGSYDGDLSLEDESELSWTPPFSATLATDPLQSIPVLHFGHGTATGTGGTPRAGLGQSPSPLAREVGNERPGTITWRGQVSAGDSGSPVRLWAGSGQALAEDLQALVGAGGQAAGVLTHRFPLAGADAQANGWVGLGTSMARVLAIAGPGWELVDSPNCPLPL